VCPKQVEEYIKSDKGKKEVLDEITHNMWRRNISGVPHFVFTSEKGLLYVGRPTESLNNKSHVLAL